VTANVGREMKITREQVIRSYLRDTGGYDSGLNVLDDLTNWRKYPDWDQPLGAFMAINPASKLQMQFAIHLFGGPLVGWELRNYLQDAEYWDVPQPGDDEDIWGGHLTYIGAYDDDKADGFDYITSSWDQLIPTTHKVVSASADEGYAFLLLAQFNAEHKSMAGFAWADAKADLARITRA
jgi:hypothetical protein